MSELPTDAIKQLLEDSIVKAGQYVDDDTELQKLIKADNQLQALLDENKRLKDECEDCPFCTPLHKQGDKQ